MDHGPADAVHHASEREVRLPRRFPLAAPPTRRLGEELRSHLAPRIVGGAQLIGDEIQLRTVRSGLEACHIQARAGEKGSDQGSHGAHANQYDVDWFSRRLGPFLGLVAGHLIRLHGGGVEGESGVCEGPDLAPLRDGLFRHVLLRRVLEPDPRMPQKLPTLFVPVSAVRGIGEKPLPRMLAQRPEELALLGDPKARERATL
jgi:hypothetical protein